MDCARKTKRMFRVLTTIPAIRGPVVNPDNVTLCILPKAAPSWAVGTAIPTSVVDVVRMAPWNRPMKVKVSSIEGKVLSNSSGR